MTAHDSSTSAIWAVIDRPYSRNLLLLVRRMRESIATRIQREVTAWPGVTVQGHRGGILFFHVGRREIGHLHGERMADLPFPVRIREELVASGKADFHYLHPKSGWVTCYIRSEEDVENILNLFRLNYGRPWLKSQVHG